MSRTDLTDIEERLKDIFSLVFGIDAASVTSDTSVDTIHNWDSLQHLNLVLAVEEEFGFNLPLDVAISLRDFASIAAAIEARLSRTESRT